MWEKHDEKVHYSYFVFFLQLSDLFTIFNWQSDYCGSVFPSKNKYSGLQHFK